MSKETFWKIQYVNLCISEYARRHKMSTLLAYRYLRDYQGLRFLDDCYEAEHTLALRDTMQSLDQVCRRNGGTL